MRGNNIQKTSIVKNTAFLYIRMLFTMLVSLFTSRVVLNALGVEDYGVYNVVGGFVTMFNVVCTGLASTTQRFITFDLGKGNLKELNKTFSSCVIIYTFMSILIFLLAESIGIWFLESKMKIPEEREYAANWVFQLSLLTLIINLISVPYNSLIIAYERMKAFAYISIFEVSAKLIVAYLICISPFDRLIVYAALICLIQLSVRLIYNVYCNRFFPVSHITWHFDIKKIKEIYTFAGWAMFGGLASIGFTQGLNMLLNLFFGPAVNAARGIAVQVQQAVNSFALNFQTAINPQIIKSYAGHELHYMIKLVFASSKFSFLLLFILSLPICIEADQILKIWLKIVPPYSVIFLRLIICTTIIDAMSNSFMRAVDATGKIKLYQSVLGTLLLTIVPISYAVLELGGSPSSVFIVHLIVCCIAFVVRLFLTKKLIHFSIRAYFKNVLARIFIVVSLSCIIPMIIYLNYHESIIRLLTVCLSAFAMSILFTYLFAMNATEKFLIKNKIKSFRR